MLLIRGGGETALFRVWVCLILGYARVNARVPSSYFSQPFFMRYLNNLSFYFSDGYP